MEPVRHRLLMPVLDQTPPNAETSFVAPRPFYVVQYLEVFLVQSYPLRLSKTPTTVTTTISGPGPRQ